MSNAIIRRPKPEEKELLLKREELLAIRLRLADLELELIDFRSSLARFEGRYLREVGIHYAELDEWKARIAELLASLHPSPKATTHAEDARQQACQSKEDSHAATSKIEEMCPSPEIKKLYREVAKLVHPDLAATPSDRERRNRFMVDANRAYEAGNQDVLQRLLDDFMDISDIEHDI